LRQVDPHYQPDSAGSLDQLEALVQIDLRELLELQNREDR